MRVVRISSLMRPKARSIATTTGGLGFFAAHMRAKSKEGRTDNLFVNQAWILPPQCLQELPHQCEVAIEKFVQDTDHGAPEGLLPGYKRMTPGEMVLLCSPVSARPR